MVYNNSFHSQRQHNEKDQHVLSLNNRACVLILSESDNYSEANKLFESALVMHKERAEETSSSSSCEDQTAASLLPSASPLLHGHNDNCYDEGCDDSNNSGFDVYDDDDLFEYDEALGDMDWDDKDDDYCRNSPSPSGSTILPLSLPSTPSKNTIPRMTTSSCLQTLSYCGQQEYHEEKHQQRKSSQQQHDHRHHHQVYSLPIVVDKTEWDTAPVQDRSFVLIFNTALCNHLWGMQLMQQYYSVAAASTTNASATTPSADCIAQHCRETLTFAKILYKLALENSVSFANGVVDKMCYVALYNNLSHVTKTLEGYESSESHWCDDMLLKAIFWWRDTTHPPSRYHRSNDTHNTAHIATNNTVVVPMEDLQSMAVSNHQAATDLYLDDDAEIINDFFDTVFYRIGALEDSVPAAAA